MTLSLERPRTSWSMPGARLVLPASAPRQEWLAARRLGVGGSDASAIAGLSSYTSLYSLWLDKRGELPEQEDTLALEWGRRLEPVVADWFTETSGIPIRRAGLMQSVHRPWQLVSLDRAAGDGGIVEIKTTGQFTRDAELWLDGEVPDHAELQSQHGMAVTNRSHAHVVVLIAGRTPVHQIVERDDALIADLCEIESRFWHDYVVTGTPPPVDGSSATTEALKAKFRRCDGTAVEVQKSKVDRLIVERETYRRQLADLAEQAERVDNELRNTLGEAERLTVDGVERVTWKANGTFSARSFAAAHPDLAVELTTTKDALDTARLKSEHPDIYAAHRARVLRVTKLKKETA